MVCVSLCVQAKDWHLSLNWLATSVDITAKVLPRLWCYKKLWERTQKSSHFKTLQTHFETLQTRTHKTNLMKSCKRCWNAVPTRSRPTTPLLVTLQKVFEVSGMVLNLKNSFQQISPLHLACQRGHVEVVNLLLEWKADVSFRSIDDRNALDYAIDFSQRSCVLTLIKHKTWKESLKNAYVDSASGW